jgi:outer membrane protein assembly factor BamB
MVREPSEPALRRRALVVGLALAAGLATAEDNWPRFRGPHGTGAVETGTPPHTWSTRDNVSWVAEIPGRGWSSPIVWGERVFVTTAINTGGRFKEPSTGIYGNDYAAELASQGLSDDQVLERVVARDIELTSDTDAIRYLVYALDSKSGAVVWEREVHRGAPFGGRHRKNTYASETPVTDGERVYVYFGNVGLYAYSMTGELAWERHWQPQPIYLDFGTASSPVVHGGRVYVQHDNQNASFLAAVDATTGEEVFRIARDGGESMIRSGWSTPFVWVHPGRTEIIAVGLGRAISYDESGNELWRLSGLTGQATPTPLAGNGLLYLATGSQGESNRPVFAVKPGGAGDISLADGAASNEFVAWTHPRASAYTSSPLLYRGRLYIVNDNGIVAVHGATTGERLYRARVGGGGHTFSASPFAYDGKVFFTSEDGETFVVRDNGEAYEEIGRNDLEEMNFASPAIVGDSLFLRTQTKLYRITAAP